MHREIAKGDGTYTLRERRDWRQDWRDWRDWRQDWRQASVY